MDFKEILRLCTEIFGAGVCGNLFAFTISTFDKDSLYESATAAVLALLIPAALFSVGVMDVQKAFGFGTALSAFLFSIPTTIFFVLEWRKNGAREKTEEEKMIEHFRKYL